MPAVLSSGLPTRSQLENWDVSHLVNGAKQWTVAADKSVQAFTQHVESIKVPGGTVWEGRAADSAYDTARDAQDVVRAQGAIKRDAALIATHGADDQRALQRAALEAISDAEANGFRVAEDLSVTDTRKFDISTAATRYVEARQCAEFIRWRTANLAASESRIADELADKAADLGGRKIGRTDAVQALDFLPSGPLPLGPENDRSWEYNIDLTSSKQLAEDGRPSAGTIASVDDAWKELNRCFNCSFPIGGAPEGMPKVGDRIPLSVGMGSNGPNLPFPVEVTQVSKTADDINIEFKTLPGHVDGEGSTIHFRFYEDGGELHLGIRGLIAHGPGAIEDFPRNLSAPVERVGYTFMAHATWQPYIDRLTTNIAAAEGIPVVQVVG